MQTYTLCLHDMCIPARLGIFPEEIAAPQTIELNIELMVDATLCDFSQPDGMPCYATLSKSIAQLLLQEHTPLCEQLAQKIADHCFTDHRLIAIDIEIIKPQAVSNARAGIRAHIERDI